MSRLRRLHALRTGAPLAGWVISPSALAASDSVSMSAMTAAWLAVLLVLAAATGGLLWWRRRERQLLAELQTARVEARSLCDLLDVWQWRTDAEHRITRWRPPQGMPADAWTPPPVGTPLWAHCRSSDDRTLRALLDHHAPIAGLCVELPLPEGGTAPCQLRGLALTDALGRFAGYVGTARVVDAQPGRRAEPAHDGEHELLGTTLSHDLRAPIRVVEGFTKILKEDYGRLLDRIGNDHLDRVLGAASRMNHMIDALLALSQLSTQTLVRQPVNLTQLASYIADDLRRQSPERQVRVVIEAGLQAQGDPTLLRVALENLLGNAWKYTGKCRDAQIWFGHDPEQPPNSFTVRDNGAGFDMRFGDRLFGVFQRLHSASDFQGTGVGLASVRRIVRRHGGEIWAEGEVDRGASFHFTLQ